MAIHHCFNYYLIDCREASKSTLDVYTRGLRMSAFVLIMRYLLKTFLFVVVRKDEFLDILIDTLPETKSPSTRVGEKMVSSFKNHCKFARNPLQTSMNFPIVWLVSISASPAGGQE